MTQRITTELIKINQYTVLERSQIKRLLKEQKFQNSGACSDVSCAVEVGKVIGAKYIVLGTVSRFGNTYSLDARFVDVESSESIRSGDYTTSKAIDNLLLQGVKSVVAQLTGEDVEDVISHDIEKSKSNTKIWKTEGYISYFRIGFDLHGSATDYTIGEGSDQSLSNPLNYINGHSGNISANPGIGLTLGYEYAKANGFGFGVDFQFFRSFDRNFNVGDFRYTSLYGVWNSTFSNGFSLFSKAGFSSLEQSDFIESYSDFFGSVEDGIYFSLGFRRPISDSMHLECGFSVNTLDKDLQGSKHTYSRPYLGLSFLF